MVITADTPVREIVVETPNAIPVLEQFGIDYCCGGNCTLAEACTKGNQSLVVVIEELERRFDGPPPDVQWQTAPLTELIHFILQKHHAFTRNQLALIQQLATKVELRHGPLHPEIRKVNEALATICEELKHHFFCEENVLFPYIEMLEQKETLVAQNTFSSIDQPVARMMAEHNQTGDELRALREITNGYQTPQDACTTYRALYGAMEDLECDLHRHIHLENNILFPRAVALESERQ